MTTEFDPPDLDTHNARFQEAYRIDGYGLDVSTVFPCPACSQPDWMVFPITAGIDDYAPIRGPHKCDRCGRVFQLDIEQPDNSTTQMHWRFLEGDDLPEFLQVMASDERGL